MNINMQGIIAKVNGEGELRNRLLDMGLIPGTQILVSNIAPFGDPIQIQVRGYELTLRKKEAQKIEMEEDKCANCINRKSKLWKNYCF